MGKTGFMSSVALCIALMSNSAQAQALRDANPPAEFPPSSFSGNQYVDSRGCVFVRAGIGGVVDWVPRVTRSREQLCGFQPSLADASEGSVISPVAANVPNPLDTPIPDAPDPEPQVAAAPEPVETPAPVVAAAPEPAPQTRTPAAIFNPLRAPAAAPSPQIIRQPAPEPVAEPEPRTITRAQACEGRSGIQPNMISSRTGQPIDCGPAPQQQVAQVAAPVAAPVATPVSAPAAQTPQRMTLSAICSDMDATGRQYINGRTGLPVRCGPQTQRITQANRVFVPAPSGVVASATAPAPAGPSAPGAPAAVAAPQAAGNATFARLREDFNRPQQPYSNPLDGAPGSTNIPTNRPTASGTAVSPCDYFQGGGLPVRCGPQAENPWQGGEYTTGQVTQRARTQNRTALQQILGQEPPPYSNPAYARQDVTPTVPDGYQTTWTDGRLNPNRGLPRQTRQIVSYATQENGTPAATQSTARVSTRTAPQPTRQAQPVEAISGQRYVQVATFDSRDAAQSVAQGLRAQGLPMRIGVYERNGAQQRIVLAGPFANASQLQRALSTARGAGYSDAFARN